MRTNEAGAALVLTELVLLNIPLQLLVGRPLLLSLAEAHEESLADRGDLLEAREGVARTSNDIELRAVDEPRQMEVPKGRQDDEKDADTVQVVTHRASAGKAAC